jgi:hypothetical protein
MSAELTLSIEAELSPARFAEVGRPAGAYRRAGGEPVALVSDFERLYGPGRAVYDGHRLRHRVSLYTADLRGRLGVFDGAAFPINDVAFHPVRPILAIATGSYDGGYLFEGALLLWDWETGESINVLSESREVARVRFADQDSLAVLLRPRDEEEFGEDAAFDTFIGGRLTDLRSYRDLGLRTGDSDPRIAGFAPTAPTTLQFDCGAFSAEAHTRHWKTMLDATDYEPRHRVWDVAWSGAARVLAVHDLCHVEAWERDGSRAFRLRGAGHGVQILQSPVATFVNVIERGNMLSGTNDKSTLLRVQDEGLVALASFDGGFLFSSDSTGRVLCRDTGDLARKRVRKDRVIDSVGRGLLAQDLGHYDCFNHHLRIDGADALYFLRGTPPSSHEAKVLCRIDASGRIAECFRWDTESRHLMGSTACLLPDGSMVRAYRVHDPTPSNFSGFIEALEMPAGRRRWRRPVPALATCLISGDEGPWLLYALTDGRLGVLDWRTGDLLHEQTLRLGNVNTVALSLAPKGNRVACGTLDGRVFILRVEGRR